MSRVLSAGDRRKMDDGNDRAFYASPRFVTHADDAFLSRLTELYASVMAPGDRVFDAMIMITLTVYRRSPPPLAAIGGKRRE